ncbi:MAG: DUF4432 family protein [Geminicoccaceae bacterium]
MTSSSFDLSNLLARASDPRQYASVRRLTLEDGAEAGVRVLAFDTGGGLAFWALEGRGLDLATLSWRGLNCAWQGPAGFVRPGLFAAESEAGQGFRRTFSGLLVTCGLGHTRQPQDGQPLHGRLPFTPARLIAAGEDWDAPEPCLYAEAELVDAISGGEHWRLHRRIEAPIGGGTIRLTDTVTNRSNETRPQPILYHTNFSYPLLRPGAVLSCNGEKLLQLPDAPSREAKPLVTCRRAPEGEWARCTIAAPAMPGWPGVQLEFAFATDSLPYLQMLEDFRPGMNLLAIEPANTARSPSGTSEPEPAADLAPGASRTYRLAFTLASD